MIIVKDVSIDNTKKVIKKYLTNKCVKYFKILKQNSIAQVRNFAWPHVNGKYVAILDSDDIWSDKSKLTKQFEFLEKNSEIVLVGSGAIVINNQGKEINTIIKPFTDVDIRKDFF